MVLTPKPEGPCNYFPYGYFHGFLQFVKRRSDLIEMITYADLNFAGDTNHENAYPSEFADWKASLRDGRRDPSKIYLLLQHDVDRVPERTHAAVRDELALGLRTNIMLFNRRVDRQLLQQKGVLYERDYDINHALLGEAERAGFTIGYHSNSYELSGFDRIHYPQVFEKEVSALRDRYDIRFFSPHGGARDRDGLSNASMDLPQKFRGDVRWVHNRYTVKFNGAYSDGAINAVRRDPKGRDFREFVKGWRRGHRYRILIHPQYYSVEYILSPKLSRAEWYVDLCNQAASSLEYDPWGNVTISSESIRANG